MRARSARWWLVAVLLTAACAPGSDTTTTDGSAATNTPPVTATPPPTTGGQGDEPLDTEWWLPAAIEQPDVVATIRPDRLWLFGVVPTADGVLLVQADDNGNGFVSSWADGAERWRTTVDGTPSVAVLGDEVVVGTNRAGAGGPATDLVVLALDDGAELRRSSVDGSYGLSNIGGEVLALDRSDEGTTIAWFDPEAARPVPLATLDLDNLVPTRDGLLAWSRSETVLLRHGETWTVARWAVGGDGQGPSNLRTATVVGDLLVRVDGGRRAAFDAAGRQVVELPLTIDPSQVWSIDGEHVAVAGDGGVEVLTVAGGTATVVLTERRDGAPRGGAVVDGTLLLSWSDGASGTVLAVTPDGVTELVAFAAPPADGGDELPDAVTFTTDGCYLETATGDTEHGSTLTLAAYAVDGTRHWSVDLTLDPGDGGQWRFGDGVAVLIHGYVLIPWRIDVYG